MWLVFSPFSFHSCCWQEVREASSAAEQQLEEFSIESEMRVDLYQAVREVADKELDSLDPPQQRLVKDMLHDYKKNGLHLPEELRNRVKELKKRSCCLLERRGMAHAMRVFAPCFSFGKPKR